MSSCDHCGLLFENIHDLQRHIKRWCPEEHSLKRKRTDDESPVKNQKYESEEGQVFNILMNKARTENESEWIDKYEKYLKRGLNEDEAQERADEKMKYHDIEGFLEIYGKLMKNILQLKHGDVHEKVMKDMNDLNSEGYSKSKSIKMDIGRNKYLLEDIRDTDEEDSINESDDDSIEENDDDSIEEIQDTEDEESDNKD